MHHCYTACTPPLITVAYSGSYGRPLSLKYHSVIAFGFICALVLIVNSLARRSTYDLAPECMTPYYAFTIYSLYNTMTPLYGLMTTGTPLCGFGRFWPPQHVVTLENGGIFWPPLYLVLGMGSMPLMRSLGHHYMLWWINEAILGVDSWPEWMYYVNTITIGEPRAVESIMLVRLPSTQWYCSAISGRVGNTHT